jgi:DNA-binding CsgD family transcriptional regulator
LSDIILGETEVIVSKLKSCLDNIRQEEQIKLSFLNKEKKAVFIELFAKYTELDGKNALIGGIIEIMTKGKEKTFSGLETSFNEFEKITEYLKSTGKNDIAEEIMNVKDLIHFEKDKKIQKLKNKVKLTKRESEILHLICDGLTNKEIADKLFISSRTVDNHRASLLLKTGTKNSASLVAFAFKNKLIKM